MSAPITLNGKQKKYEETFTSPFQKDTEEEALRVLDSIRKEHDESHGWVEFAGYAKQLSNGKWIAERHHAKYV